MNNNFNNIDQNLCPLDNVSRVECVEGKELQVLRIAEDIFNSNGKVDIVSVAKELGLKVFATKDIKTPSVIFYDKKTESFEIYVNEKDSKQRQRFSIAHEIAHFIKHNLKVKQLVMVDREGACSLSPDEEKEADALAAEILMPKSCVLEFLKEKTLLEYCKFDINEIELLAKKFDVSIIASAIRLRDLGFYVRYV